MRLFVGKDVLGGLPLIPGRLARRYGDSFRLYKCVSENEAMQSRISTVAIYPPYLELQLLHTLGEELSSFKGVHRAAHDFASVLLALDRRDALQWSADVFSFFKRGRDHSRRRCIEQREVALVSSGP